MRPVLLNVRHFPSLDFSSVRHHPEPIFHRTHQAKCIYSRVPTGSTQTRKQGGPTTGQNVSIYVTWLLVKQRDTNNILGWKNEQELSFVPIFTF